MTNGNPKETYWSLSWCPFFFLWTSGFFDVYLYIYSYLIFILLSWSPSQLSSFTVLLKIKQAFRRNLQSGHLGITFGAPLSVYSCKVMVEQSKNYSSLAQQNTATLQATNDGNYNFWTGAVKSFLAVFMALYAHGGEGTMPSRRESVLFRVNLW